ncbi:hypothetical protein [Candidatus Aeolococcus gillhamiae]|uniref:hypothetical protein n=1 Tax=Candidatus Aeolococcus gillhamiae TaxID=3127015 RepID=UPI003076E39A
MTFMLIPGAGGYAGYWRHVVAKLHAHGHDAIPVDRITPDEMPGGHLVALSRPAELCDRLEAHQAEL